MSWKHPDPLVNQLLELVKSQGELLTATQDIVVQLNARVSAQQAAMYSLIATHTNPKLLFDQFATFMDLSAPEFGKEPMLGLPEEMQRLQERIRRAANKT